MQGRRKKPVFEKVQSTDWLLQQFSPGVLAQHPHCFVWSLLGLQHVICQIEWHAGCTKHCHQLCSKNSCWWWHHPNSLQRVRTFAAQCNFSCSCAEGELGSLHLTQFCLFLICLCFQFWWRRSQWRLLFCRIFHSTPSPRCFHVWWQASTWNVTRQFVTRDNKGKHSFILEEKDGCWDQRLWWAQEAECFQHSQKKRTWKREKDA